MTFPRTLLAALGCSILTAMMAACGGGGGSSFIKQPPPPPPPPTGNNYTTCANQQVPNWQYQQFISNYQQAMTALVNHVSATSTSYHSSIGYVRIGLGKGGEINLPQGWDDSSSGACYGGYTGKWGYTAGSPSDNWNTYLQTMVQFEKTLNAPFPLLVSITPITDVGTEVDDFIAPIAVANGMSFGNQGLQTSDMTNYPNCGGDWCNLFQLNPQIKELQTLGQSCPQGLNQCSGMQGGTGPLPPLLAFATGQGSPTVQYPANDLELYYQDWLIAYDPTNSDNGTYGAAYASAFQSASEFATMQVLFPDPTNSDIATYVLTQPIVTGVVLDVDWSDFDLGNGNASGNYNWGITDSSISGWLAVNPNLKINLVLQNTTYGGSGCPSGGIGSNGNVGSNCAMPAWMWTVLQ
jgi:hypothetical protein